MRPSLKLLETLILKIYRITVFAINSVQEATNYFTSKEVPIIEATTMVQRTFISPQTSYKFQQIITKTSS